MKDLVFKEVKICWMNGALAWSGPPENWNTVQRHRVLAVDSTFIKLTEINDSQEEVGKPFYIPLAVIARIDEVD